MCPLSLTSRGWTPGLVWTFRYGGNYPSMLTMDLPYSNSNLVKKDFILWRFVSELATSVSCSSQQCTYTTVPSQRSRPSIIGFSANPANTRAAIGRGRDTSSGTRFRLSRTSDNLSTTRRRAFAYRCKASSQIKTFWCRQLPWQTLAEKRSTGHHRSCSEKLDDLVRAFTSQIRRALSLPCEKSAFKAVPPTL